MFVSDLENKGWIVEAQTKAKSVVLTEEGERLAREFLRKHFSALETEVADAVEDASSYQLKVTLAGSDPPIWRRIRLAGRTTLAELHAILQIVMGWTNSHLHQFVVRGSVYSDPMFELEDATDEHTAPLRTVLPVEGASLMYEYDFGDGWEHHVVVESIESPTKRASAMPNCTAGERACPPEDCGGVHGYEEYLAALADKRHERHREMVEWRGGDFDSEAFDRRSINRWLKKLRA